MNNLIFDTHAHYDDEAFDNDRDCLLKEMFSTSVAGIISCGVNIETSKFSINLSEKYDNVYSAVGIHPLDVNDATLDDIDKIKELLNHPKCVAVGEIGLDYHYNFTPKEKQIEYIKAQLNIAKKFDMPVIIHDRESHEDILNLLKEYKPKGVVHCFSGSVEMAREIIKLGMYIGLGGAVTFRNAKKPIEVAKEIPLDRLLLETDAPYMTPVPCRGKRCDSRHIKYTAQKIAETRDIDVNTIFKHNLTNVNNLFKINIDQEK